MVFHRFLVLVGILAVGFRFAYAQEPKVTLTINPSTIKLAPNETTRAIVIVNNRTAFTISELRLSNSTAAATITLPATDGISISAKGSTALEIDIKREGAAPVAGSVFIRLDYGSAEPGPAAEPPGVVVAQLEVQDREPDLIEKVATARTETTLDLIQEQREGTIFLVVTNVSSSPLKIKSLKVEMPPFIKIKSPERPVAAAAAGGTSSEFGVDESGLVKLPDSFQPLQPQESRPFKFTVTADDSVLPGRHMLLFKIDLEQTKYGYTWQGTLIATHKSNVAVFGESEVLTALGVPSFLLLPGFLILIAFKFAWTRLAPKGQLDMDVKGAEFWMLAVFLSLLAAATYPALTDLLGERRDYLAGYGLKDVVRVWFGSVFVAWAFWGLLLASQNIRSRVRALYEPSEEDKPVDVLRKLARNRLALRLPQVAVTHGGQEQLVFDITPPLMKPFLSQAWVAPPMLIHWRQAVRRDDEVLLRQHKSRFDDLRIQGSARAMAEFVDIREGEVGAPEAVSWVRTGTISRPSKVPKADVKPQSFSLYVIREAD